MKKSSFILIAIFATMFSTSCMAQYMLNQTHVNPISFDSRTEQVSLNLSYGSTFNGRKDIGLINGQVSTVSYYGTLKKADGTRLITFGAGYGFNQNFQIPNGSYAEITPNGEVYVVNMQNGRMTSRYQDHRKYTITNHCIAFETQSYGGGYTNNNTFSGYSSGGSSSNSSSSYDAHSATCMGCHGTGKCGHCHGRGLDSNGHKCGLCNGRGTCASCAGVGKIFGSFH